MYQNFSDRRKHERIPVLEKVQVRNLKDNKVYEGKAWDMSPGGMFISMDELLPRGDRVELIFNFFEDPGETILEAEVAWIRKEQPGQKVPLPSGIGVRFLDLDPVKKKYVEDSFKRIFKAQTWLQETQEDLFSALVHDLKTPTLSIINNMDILTREGYLNDYQQECVSSIMCAVQTQVMMIDNVLHMVKTKSREINLVVAPFKILPIFKEVVKIFRPMIFGDEIELIIEKQIDSSLEVLGDRERIKEVLLNLVNNAFQATSWGRISLVAEDDGDRVKLAVRDTGCGIPADKIPFLFNKFFQVQSARGSAGLGLYIVRLIILAHDQEIYVKSEVGKGSEFYFYLPRSQGEEEK